MSIQQFTSDGIHLFFDGNPIPDTNLLNIDDLQKRFIADIIKDAKVLPNVPNINTLIQNTCKFNGRPISISSYEKILNELNTIVFDNKLIKKNIYEFNNILKISTQGVSNTRISDATDIFWESGFGVNDICRNPKRIVTTPASLLDTINKQQGNAFFPIEKPIVFSESFTKRLGFPDNVKWETAPLIGNSFQVNIVYKNDVSINSKVYTKNEKRVSVAERFGAFTPFSKGNELKNIELNKLGNKDNAKTLKILLTKELGDVAQVWVYLAYIMNHLDITEMRKKTVMITTDSVVLLFCAILHLSCIYTGSREGVKSGNCTLKHYLAGSVDYELKLNNMLNILCDNIINHNIGLINGLDSMIKDVNSFVYYRNNNRRTYGGFNTNPIKQDLMKKRFEREKAIIKKKNVYMVGLKTQLIRLSFFSDGLEANDANVNKIFSDYSFITNFLKHFQIVTKVKANQFLLNPADVNAGILTSTETDFRDLLFGLIGILEPIELLSGDLLTDIFNIVFNDDNKRGGEGKRKRSSQLSTPPPLLENENYKNIRELVDNCLGTGYKTANTDMISALFGNMELSDASKDDEISEYCRKYGVGYYEFLVLFTIFVTFFKEFGVLQNIQNFDNLANQIRLSSARITDNGQDFLLNDFLSMIYDAIVSKAHHGKTLQWAFRDTFFLKTEGGCESCFDTNKIADIVPENIIKHYGFILAQGVYFQDTASYRKSSIRPSARTKQTIRRKVSQKTQKTMKKSMKKLFETIKKNKNPSVRQIQKFDDLLHKFAKIDG